MTHPTDEELDALVERLDNLFAMLEEEGYYTKANTADFARKAITTLRTQLATLQLHLDSTNDKLEIERALTDGAHRRAREAEAEAHACGAEREAWKARADRAEAERAAQIEVDAELVRSMDNGRSDDEWIDYNLALLRAFDKIRRQPHDRTALDRMLAEAREKALREAILEGMRIAIFTPIEQVPAAIDDAILALIEADHAQP